MTSEKSGSSREGPMDSSREAAQISAGGDREGFVSSEPRRLSTQRSLTTDTLEMSEDSFAMGDTSGDNPFQLEVTEYHQDPKLVNIHQFFPALDHNFTRAVSGRLGEERQALRAIAEEDGHSVVTNDDSAFSRDDSDSQCVHPDQTDGSKDNEQRQQSQTPPSDRTAPGDSERRTSKEASGTGEATPSMPEGSSVSGSEPTSQWQGAGDSLTNDPQFVRVVFGQKPASSGGVFSTAVDEDVIEAAQRRKQSIFTADDWSEEKTATYSLTEIIHTKAYEHYQKALQLQTKGQWGEAVTALNKAINLKGDEAAFYRQRGEAFLQLCDFQSAILNYKKACLLATADTAAYQRLTFLFYFHGQCLFDQRLYPEALEAFSRAAEMNPDNVGYHIRSISCLAALQRHGECLALVNKRLEVDNNNPDLYIMRARLHDMFRNTTLCYYDVKDALGLEPGHPEAQHMMRTLEEKAGESRLQAMQLNIAGKHREALQKISIAIETNPSVAEYHVLRGALHRKLNDFNAAIDDFLLALDKCDHNEDNPVYGSAQRQLLLTYNDFAVECFTKGFFDEAVILLNKAIKGEKNEKGLYINRGDCFFKQGELNFALQDYHQALELDGADVAVGARISVIHNEFGVNLYQDKNYVDAEAKFSLALQYNPQVGQYYISRSRARYMLENMAGARQDLLLGLLLDPTNEDILSIMARLFPGKSVADVINSPAADNARLVLYNMGPASALTAPVSLAVPGPPVQVALEGESSQTAQEGAGNSGGAVWKPAVGLPPLAMCVEEKEFNQVMVQEKRKVELEVKDALENRRSLRYQGARIQPLPPTAPHPRYGSQLKGRAPVVSPAVRGRKKGAYNWRTFSLGIGLQDS
ncbi:tetratricopeptide repeat protein 16-like isoform X2 [Babylonia areolata]|uniref:tetratricopeptide repeat protein 16-like isoform X2 n=1 Tax=Babylonia areolata TaxID=304850 RepID=UPI003FD0009D